MGAGVCASASPTGIPASVSRWRIIPPPTLGLRGRVRYSGEPEPDEIRVQTSRGGVTATATVDEDGAFVMAGLPAGTYAVRAIAYRHVARQGEAHPRLDSLAKATASLRTGDDGVGVAGDLGTGSAVFTAVHRSTVIRAALFAGMAMPILPP